MLPLAHRLGLNASVLRHSWGRVLSRCLFQTVLLSCVKSAFMGAQVFAMLHLVHLLSFNSLEIFALLNQLWSHLIFLALSRQLAVVSLVNAPLQIFAVSAAPLSPSAVSSLAKLRPFVTVLFTKLVKLLFLTGLLSCMRIASMGPTHSGALPLVHHPSLSASATVHCASPALSRCPSPTLSLSCVMIAFLGARIFAMSPLAHHPSSNASALVHSITRLLSPSLRPPPSMS